MDYIVYMLLFPENNMYIGLTNNKDRRLREHKANFSSNFDLVVLKDELTHNEAELLETSLIDEYRKEYGSKLLNKAEKGIAPTGLSGSEHNNSKLSSTQISEIRQAWIQSKGNISLDVLAEEYLVSKSCIHNLVQNKSYVDKNYIPMSGQYRNNKLTFSDIRAIREEYRETRPVQKQLADKYGITSQYLGRLVAGKALRQAGGPLKGIDYD